ncbi:hypothetical protein HN011_006486 [Eciton burchellii]|nr:hypothetical protein HN011_006486 [Eciton burchellii]
MDFVGGQYYKLNRILLLCIGLWPYETSCGLTSFLRKIQIIFFQALFISILLCQVNVFLVKNYNIVLIMKTCLFILINCIFIIKYNAWLLLINNIKYIFDRVRYDWNILKNQTELEIIQEYASNARFHTAIFTLLSILICLGILILSFVPSILDIIIPMNESRPLYLPIVLEYFVDQERFFYLIMVHIFIFGYAGFITISAVATMLIAYVLHNCAIFKIASYRIEHIFDEKILETSKSIRQYMLYKRLIHAIYFHRRAIDLTNILTKSFTILYFVLLGFGVASMSFSIIYFIHALFLNDVIDLLMVTVIIFIQLYYIFVGNYVGQDIIDTSSNIFQIIYNTEWYTAPLWLQKLIFFMMQRSKIKSALTAGGLFDASLEGFARLMSMSVSYIMFLRST